MTDLIALMSKLVTPQGKILVPGVEDLVAPLTEEEKCVMTRNISEILRFLTYSIGNDTKF